MDREAKPAKFLLLGSASMALLRQAGESLAGRVAVVEVGGFDLEEVGIERTRALWFRGGAPLSFLASDDEQSLEWRTRFIEVFLVEGPARARSQCAGARDAAILDGRR